MKKRTANLKAVKHKVEITEDRDVKADSVMSQVLKNNYDMAVFRTRFFG